MYRIVRGCGLVAILSLVALFGTQQPVEGGQHPVVVAPLGPTVSSCAELHGCGGYGYGRYGLGTRMGLGGALIDRLDQVFSNFLTNVGIAPPGGGVQFSRQPGLMFNAPEGGYTLYPGQAGSGTESASDYSHINHRLSADAAAALVCARLRELGIPPVRPQPKYLWVNPHGATGVTLPFPDKWIPKEKEEDEKDKDKMKEKGKEDEKAKDTEKVKGKDEDKDALKDLDKIRDEGNKLEKKAANKDDDK